MILLPDSENDAAICSATLKLGEIHWYLLKAATVMSANTLVTRKVEGLGGFEVIQPATSDCAKQVGRDEIHWWIYRKESNVEELRRRSQNALEAAQSLKQAADALRRNRFESYPEVVNSLREFAESHTQEIDVIHGYVRWLAERDILAPHILFTYRVWGSTRRSDRWIDVDTRELEEEKHGKIRHLAEIVLGLRSSRLYAFDKAQFEIGAEMAEAAEDGTAEIAIPIRSVVRRASAMIFENCSTYFTEIRDSLRNILLDVDKFTEQDNLIHSDGFWREFVLKAVGTSKVETQHWDFKQTLRMWVTKGEEKERAKFVFAEDVASFANATGGVLVVGVTDRREIVGIGDDPSMIESRLKFASDVLARHLEYDRPIIGFHQVLVPDTLGVDRICLVVIAAQACGAVGVRDHQGRYTYPVRRETGTDRVSGNDLAMHRIHMKSDNHDFLRILSQFVREN